MNKKTKEGKTVDEFLTEIERDLKRLDDTLEAQGKKIKQDVKGFEEKFEKFMAENDIDMSELRDKAGHEFDRLKNELDHTAKALKDSFHYFRKQYQNRKKQD